MHDMIQSYRRTEATTFHTNAHEGLNRSGQVCERCPKDSRRFEEVVEAPVRQREKPGGADMGLLPASDPSAARRLECVGDIAARDMHAADMEGNVDANSFRIDGKPSSSAGRCASESWSYESDEWDSLRASVIGRHVMGQPGGSSRQWRGFSHAGSPCDEHSPGSRGSAQQEVLPAAASLNWRRRSCEGWWGHAEADATEASSLAVERRLLELQLRLKKEQRERQLAEEGIKVRRRSVEGNGGVRER